MNKLFVPIVALLLIFSSQVISISKKAIEMVPGLNSAESLLPAPESKDLVALVQPVLDTKFEKKEDADNVKVFCLEFADVLKRDSEAKVIVDTADLRDRLEASSKLMFQETGMGAKYPSLGAQINNILAKYLDVVDPESSTGEIKVVELDGEPNYRNLAIEAFNGIAWACQR